MGGNIGKNLCSGHNVSCFYRDEFGVVPGILLLSSVPEGGVLPVQVKTVEVVLTKVPGRENEDAINGRSANRLIIRVQTVSQ